MPPRLYFRVPPEPSHLLRARERLRDYLRQYCTAAELIDDVVLCVEEACTNAIRHSGAADDIEISLAFVAEGLVATVKDRGRGFAVEGFDARRSPDPSSDHGRGLFIIASLTDSLELSLDGGLEVRMVRRGAPRCEPQPLESGLGVPRAGDVVGHSDARTRAMLEEIDEGFFALDWEYRYLHANQAAQQIAQKPLEELLGHTPWELFPQLQGSPLAEHYRAAMELGVPSVFEHRSMVTGDWLEVRIYPTPAGVSAYYRQINEHKRRESELEKLIGEQRRHAQLSEALNAINAAVSAHLESSDVLQDVLRLAGEAFGCDAANVAVRDAGQWTPTQVWNMPSGFVDRRFRGEEMPYAELALVELRPVALEDYRHDPLGNAEIAERFDVGATLAIPLTVGAGGFGCLFFTYYGTPHRFTELEVDFARKTGAVVSQALENVRHYRAEIESQKQAVRELETTRLLSAAGGSLAESLALAEVLDRLARIILEVTSDSRVTVSLWNERRERLEVMASQGESPLQIGLLVALDELSAPARQAIADRTPVLIDYDALEPGRRGVADRRPSHLALDVPLFFGDRLVGLLAIDDPAERREFSDREIDLMVGIAAHAAVAIENARLFEAEVEAQRRASRELETTGLLLEAATAVASWIDLDQILGSLGDLLLRSTRRSRIVIELWDEERREVEIAVSRGGEAVPRQRFALDGLSDGAREAITTGRTVVISYDDAVVAAAVREYVDEHEFLLVLMVPIVHRERTVGLIVADEPGQRRPFTPREIRLVEAIAAQAGVAIENARLFEAELAAREMHAQRVGRLSILKEVADSASSSLNVRAVATSVVGAVLRLLGARQVQIRLVSQDGTLLESAASAGLPQGFLERLGPVPVDSDWETADCFRSGQPRIGEDVGTAAVSDASRRNAQDAGVRSYLLLPLLAGGQALGTYYLAWAEPRAFGPEEVSFAETVAAQSATGLENARLFEAEQRAQQRAKLELDKTVLLQEVTKTASSSLSLSEIGRRVLALTTRALGASAGGVYALDEAEGTLHALALVGHADEVARRIAAVPLDEQSSIGYLVVHDLPLITHDAKHIGPAGKEHARQLSATGDRWLAVPIKRAETILGVLGFAFAGERPFEQDELSLYRSIAELLGAALDNARLYDAQRRIATTLQENLIHPFPTVAGLELGVVAQTAYEPERVGGDFSDVFVLDASHVAVLIGDVAGKGLRAAGHTETVRSKVRAFATIDPSPADVLARTNELLLRLDPDDPHVTAFLAVLDPRSGHLDYASAGHPAPVHLGARSCDLIDVPYGLPLGSFARPYLNAQAVLTPEDYLVLYTDGVTEARRGDELLGAERLLEIVSGLRGRSAQEVAEGIRDAVLDFAGTLRDDLQVVVARLA